MTDQDLEMTVKLLVNRDIARGGIIMRGTFDDVVPCDIDRRE